MPDPARHAESRNFVESILRYIPGFRGYLEKEYRRESDHMARIWMADRLQSCKRGLDDYMRNLVDAGQIDALTQCERLRTRMDGLINGLRGQVRGYSAIFDYARVKQDTLEQVYQHDLALMEEVDQYGGEVEQLASKTNPPTEVIPQLMSRLDEISRKYDQRSEILKGLQPD